LAFKQHLSEDDLSDSPRLDPLVHVCRILETSHDGAGEFLRGNALSRELKRVGLVHPGIGEDRPVPLVQAANVPRDEPSALPVPSLVDDEDGQRGFLLCHAPGLDHAGHQADRPPVDAQMIRELGVGDLPLF
jgi:hypothetical protein